MTYALHSNLEADDRLLVGRRSLRWSCRPRWQDRVSRSADQAARTVARPIARHPGSARSLVETVEHKSVSPGLHDPSAVETVETVETVERRPSNRRVEASTCVPTSAPRRADGSGRADPR